MSRLRIYWPTDDSVDTAAEANSAPLSVSENAVAHSRLDSNESLGEPEILQFEIHAKRIRSTPQYDVTQHARKLHRNNICPHCHSIRIVPVHLNDGTSDHAGEIIPMTASLVAFHCERCQAEWPA